MTVAMSMSLELLVPRRLLSPNATRGFHWSVRAREAIAWEHAIAGTWPAEAASWILAPREPKELFRRGRRLYLRREKERRTVSIVRRVPSRRNFILDDDNLTFAAKPVLDALVRLGLLTDDSRIWTRLAPVTQEVSGDGTDWTVIRLGVW